MQRDRKLIAALLAALLLLGLCLLTLAQLHESLHDDDDCPLCLLARTWRGEKRAVAAAALCAVAALVCCLRRRLHPAVFRRPETLTAQKVLLLS